MYLRYFTSRKRLYVEVINYNFAILPKSNATKCQKNHRTWSVCLSVSQTVLSALFLYLKISNM